MPLKRAQFAEELRQFFCISTELLDPRTSDAEAKLCLGEIEAILMHTTSLRLRQRCCAMLNSHHLPVANATLA